MRNNVSHQPDLFPEEKKLAERIVEAKNYFSRMMNARIEDKRTVCPNCGELMNKVCKNCGYWYNR